MPYEVGDRVIVKKCHGAYALPDGLPAGSMVEVMSFDHGWFVVCDREEREWRIFLANVKEHRTMNLREAYELGHKIKAVLEPFCLKLEVVGSIRRAREHVNDIDIVCLPKPGELTALQRRCRQNAEVVTDGPQAMTVRLRNNVQVDLWFARERSQDLLDPTPGNYGSLLLCRTGSKEHNIYIAEEARRQDLKWEISRGLVAGADSHQAKVIASETEEEIFQVLGMDFIPPAARER